MASEDFKPSDELIHKATLKRCVVIAINDDGTLKVKTSDDEEKDYYPVELRRIQTGLVRRNPKKHLY